MIEIIWRHDPDDGVAEGQPTTAPEARARLDSESAAFAALGEFAREVAAATDPRSAPASAAH
jgi:hypothetical protein